MTQLMSGTMGQDTGDTRELVFGPYRLDRANARLLCDGRPVALTPKAFDVLHYLASRPDRLVTKDELLSAVWSDVIVSDASIKVCVREIRKALDDEIKSPRFIETVHRRGYRFISPVNAPKAGDQEVAPDSDEVPAARPTTSAPDPPPEPQRPVHAPPCVSTAPSRHALVGRDEELRRLGEFFALALAGQRQCVFVSAGPGCGKTALVETFVRLGQSRTEGGESPILLAGHCFEQFGTSEPYMPVWEAIGGLARQRPSPTLSALLARHAAAVVPATASPGDPAHAAAVEPRAMSERLLREMADGIEALAAESPVILWLEDVHWADYSTLDLISALARRRSPARLMVLATYRPAEVLAGEHPLRGLVRGLLTGGLGSEIALDFLDEPDVARFLDVRFPGGQFPPALTHRLHQRTDGHPLFLVHLVNDLVEQGVLVEQSGVWRVADAEGTGQNGDAAGWLAVLETQIPQTIRAMIEVHLERLDRPERQALEAAAVAGVEFSAAEAAAAVGGELLHVEEVCDALARRHRFLEARGLSEWPDGTAATHFRFVHELYHNVVYEQIPVARRVRLHQAVGLRLEAAWGERAAEEAAGLAMHFEQARDWPRAAKYLRHASNAAARQYAHREAVHYLRRALAALERLPPRERTEDELSVLMCLAVNLQVTEGCAAPEVRDIHARAYRLCQGADGPGGPEAAGGSASPDDLRRLFPVLWGMWVFQKVRSELRKAAAMARQLLDMARRAEDPALMLQAHQAMAVTGLCLGVPDIAREQMEQAAAIYDPERHAANTEWFGQDPGVATMAFGAVGLCLLGRPIEAVAASERAMALARRSHQPSSLALAMHFAAMMHQCRGDAASTERWARASHDLGADEGFSFWLAGGKVLLGWAWVAGESGNPAGGGPHSGPRGEAGVAEIRRGIELWLATGSRTYYSYYLGLLADALLRLGRPAEALPVLDEAMHAARSLPEGLYEAELHRLKGRCLLEGASAADRGAVSDTASDEVAACFSEAISVARGQGAQWFEWRAARDLADLWRRQGRAKEADELLTTAGAGADLPNCASFSS